MKAFFYKLTTPIGLAMLSRPTWAAAVNPPAPVLEWSFYVLLIFAVCVAAFVFFNKSSDKNEEPLSNMLGKGRRAINWVQPDTSVTDSVRQMNDENIGALLVMEGDKLTGIFTERDALNTVLAAGIDPVKTKVSEVMTRKPLCVDPSTTIEEAMSIVTNTRVRHLPIVHNGSLVGLVSSGDLTRWLVEDRAGEIRDLVAFASGPKGLK